MAVVLDKAGAGCVCAELGVCVRTVAEPVGTAACCSVGKASCCCAKLLLLLLLLLLAACGARCIVPQGTLLVSCRQVPSSDFVGVHSLSAIPEGDATSRRGRVLRCCCCGLCCCCVAALWTLRRICKLQGLWAFSCLAFFFLLWERLWVRERILRRHSGASAPPLRRKMPS